VYIFVSFIPFGNMLIFPLENKFKVNPKLPTKIDGIIVLSGAVNAKPSILKNQVQVNEQVERDLFFMKLARKYPDAKLVYSGGSSSLTHQAFKGAYAGKMLLENQSFDTSRVIFEGKSRNTYESALNLKELINPKKKENWILITTAWHMPRAVGVFKKVDFNVIAYPVDFWTTEETLYDINFDFTSHLSKLEVGFKEWLGLFAYKITNKI
jgi:uncharacterized SAM-binding protein YcdF (DUF218 family)